MKLSILSLVFLLSSFIFSPTEEDSSPHVFPIGSKFVLKLIEKDNGKFDVEVLSESKIKKKVDYSKSESYFSKKPIPGTIECIFAKGEKFKSVLLIRNNTKFALNYKADISYNNSGKFYSTSVMMLFPGVSSSELWKDNLKGIILHDFTKEED